MMIGRPVAGLMIGMAADILLRKLRLYTEEWCGRKQRSFEDASLSDGRVVWRKLCCGLSRW
jgi:hypothetical protein